MAAITAKAVAELRAKTNCGMMECKKALTEAEGNFDEAIKILREKGLATAAKKADRIAAEGVVDILREGKTAAMIEVNAETDFVAKNDTFVEFVKGLLRTIIANRPADVEALSKLSRSTAPPRPLPMLLSQRSRLSKRTSPSAVSSLLTDSSIPTFTATAPPVLSSSSIPTTPPPQLPSSPKCRRTLLFRSPL